MMKFANALAYWPIAAIIGSLHTHPGKLISSDDATRTDQVLFEHM
jgi:hypothetical protein